MVLCNPVQAKRVRLNRGFLWIKIHPLSRFGDWVLEEGVKGLVLND